MWCLAYFGMSPIANSVLQGGRCKWFLHRYVDTATPSVRSSASSLSSEVQAFQPLKSCKLIYNLMEAKLRLSLIRNRKLYHCDQRISKQCVQGAVLELNCWKMQNQPTASCDCIELFIVYCYMKQTEIQSCQSRHSSLEACETGSGRASEQPI